MSALAVKFGKDLAKRGVSIGTISASEIPRRLGVVTFCFIKIKMLFISPGFHMVAFH